MTLGQHGALLSCSFVVQLLLRRVGLVAVAQSVANDRGNERQRRVARELQGKGLTFWMSRHLQGFGHEARRTHAQDGTAHH